MANCFDSITTSQLEFTAQAGFNVGEGLGSSYIIPDPDPATPGNQAFPIEISSIEFVVVTPATEPGNPIRFGYRIEVWDGEPGVAGSQAVFTVESTDQPIALQPPDLEIPRASNAGGACDPLLLSLGLQNQGAGVKAQFSLDASDPNRIIVNNTSNTGRVSVFVTILRHNLPTANPCDTPSPCDNAFFATEGATVTPCASPSNPASPTYPTRNWFFALNCPGGCPAGYTRFSNLGACRPTRDLLHQITYIPAECGVCCRGSTCAAGLSQSACNAPSGIGFAYLGSVATCNTGSTTTPCCLADFDKAGGVTVADIFNYLNAWFASSPFCDFGGTGDTAPNVANIFDFLNAWFLGGC